MPRADHLPLPARRLLAALALFLPAVWAPNAAGGTDPWRIDCQEGARGRFCTAIWETAYPENRGGSGRVTVTLRRDEDCTSLHVGFDRSIDPYRPVTLVVDEDPPEEFYTSEELNELARAVDNGRPPRVTGPALVAFWRDHAGGDVEQAARELVARFARVKNADRLSVACPSAKRLLTRLAGVRTLRIAFHVDNGKAVQDYHWPALDRREVVIPAAPLVAALGLLPSG